MQDEWGKIREEDRERMSGPKTTAKSLKQKVKKRMGG